MQSTVPYKNPDDKQAWRVRYQPKQRLLEADYRSHNGPNLQHIYDWRRVQPKRYDHTFVQHILDWNKARPKYHEIRDIRRSTAIKVLREFIPDGAPQFELPARKIGYCLCGKRLTGRHRKWCDNSCKSRHRNRDRSIWRNNNRDHIAQYGRTYRDTRPTDTVEKRRVRRQRRIAKAEAAIQILKQEFGVEL